MTKLKPYSANRFTKISRELLDKNYRTRLGLHAQKLLYGLASNLSDMDQIFPVWDVPIDSLFKYLNLSKGNHDRYNVVREAIMEIARNPLEYKINERKWGVWSWLDMAAFDEENSNNVKICFSNNVKPFLLQLNEYCRLEARYYVELTGNYAMWLYPLLRNVANKKDPVLILSLQEIRELTHNENTDSYDPAKSKDANRDIIRQIIGIERKSGNVWQCRTRKTKDGKIIETGTIAEINEKTDILVYAEALKSGRSITAVRFFVEFKSETYQGKRKQIRALHRIDYKDENTKKMKIEEIKNAKIEDIGVPIESVENFAKIKNMTVEALLKEMGYYKSKDGKMAIKLKK